MAKGANCPHCGKKQFHDKGSYIQCSNCDYIGWTWEQRVQMVGKGKGNLCSNCGNSTLHVIVELESGHRVRRCCVCDAVGIDPVA